MGRVSGKIAVVTGGSLGIGKACATLLGEQGSSVAVVDVLDKAGKDTVKSLVSKGVKAKFYHLDVTRESKVQKIFKKIERDFGCIDILVNNAGVAGVSKPTHEVTEREWDQVMNVNAKGVFLCTKHVIPAMQRAGGGSIVNLSSIFGIVGSPDIPAYHASKGAVRTLTKSDALIYAKDKIRVNSVHPGMIWTPMVERQIRNQTQDIEAGKQVVGTAHPLGHIGEVEDIAYGVLYLASDESKFVTGSELVIDGGYTCQ